LEQRLYEVFGLYMPHPGSFELARVQESYTHIEEVLQATRKLSDHIYRYSTRFVSVNARINS